MCLCISLYCQAICFREREAGKEDVQGDMPFEATETKNSTRGGWNRLRIDKDEAYDRLLEVRNEFEVRRGQRAWTWTGGLSTPCEAAVQPTR
jgi:hypothetical protein